MANIIVEKKVAPKSHDEKSSVFDFFVRFFAWFIVIVCLAILFSGYWFLLKPKVDSITVDRENLSRDEDYLAKSDYLIKMNEIIKMYNDISREDKNRIEYILSSKYDFPRLKTVITRELNVLVESLNPKDKSPIVNIESIEVVDLDNPADKFPSIVQVDRGPLVNQIGIAETSVTISGLDYIQFKEIMKELRTNLRLMDVIHLEYDPVAVIAKLKILVYYKK